MYVPPPSVDLAAKFYGAIFGAEPVAERHGDGPDHWSITGGGLVIEVYPATTRPHTVTRLEFTGPDAEAAAERLHDVTLGCQQTRDGNGWWDTDPAGNTVVLLRG